MGIFNCLIFLGNYLQLKLGRGGSIVQGSSAGQRDGLGNAVLKL